MGFWNAIGGIVGGGLNYLGGAFTHPIDFIKNPTQAKIEYVNTVNSGLAGQFKAVGQTLGTTALVAGAIIGGGAIAGSESAIAISSKLAQGSLAVAKAAFTSPIKTVVLTGGGIIGYNAITSSNKAAESTANIPANLAQFGQNIGKAIDDPTLNNILNIGKENPILTGLVGAAAAVTVAGGIGSVANLVSNYENTQAVKKNTQATLEGGTNPQMATLQNPVSQTPSAGKPLKASTPRKKKKHKKKVTNKKKRHTHKKKKSIKRRRHR